MEHNDNDFILENVVIPGQMGFDFGGKKPLNRFIGQIEYYPVSRTFVFIFAVVSSILVNLSIFIYSALQIGSFPEKLPLIYNYIEKIWIQIDRFLIIPVPFIIFALELGIIFYCIRISFIDRRLANMSLAMLAIFNVLIAISAVQIFSLVS